MSSANREARDLSVKKLRLEWFESKTSLDVLLEGCSKQFSNCVASTLIGYYAYSLTKHLMDHSCAQTSSSVPPESLLWLSLTYSLATLAVGVYHAFKEHKETLQELRAALQAYNK